MAECTSFSKFIISRHAETLKKDFIQFLYFNWKYLIERECWQWDLQPGVRPSVHDICGFENDLYFRVSFRFTIGDDKYNKRSLSLQLSYSTSFDNELNTIERCDWEFDDEMERLNDYLIPEIEDMDDAAEKLLSKVYGDQIPESINAHDFAKRLGLNVYIGKVEGWPYDTMGAVFFREIDTVLHVFEDGPIAPVPASSIVVNSHVFKERNIGSVNNTIIHECVHYALHWRVFVFRSIVNEDYDWSVTCRDYAKEGDDNCTRLIERQANLLAPRILMRKSCFVSHVQYLIDDFYRVRNDFRVIKNRVGGMIDADIISKYVIQSLTSKYGVSSMSIKIRMIETGFEIARGVNIYLDDRYLRPISFEPGSLGTYETYSLSRESYEKLLSENEDFKACIATGLFRFVENHVVFCHPKYCEPVCSKDGFLLTDFARSHMNLCAMKFWVFRKGASYSYCSNAMSVMLRLPTVTVNESLVFIPNNNGDKLKITQAYREQWMAFYKNTKCYGWNERLRAIMKEQGEDLSSLARECNVSYDTMQRYMADKEGHRMPKRVFTHICMILGIPYFISQKLIEESGFLRFDSFDTSDSCYLELLVHYYGQGIEYCNEYMSKCGVEPFTSEMPNRRKRLMNFPNVI